MKGKSRWAVWPVDENLHADGTNDGVGGRLG